MLIMFQHIIFYIFSSISLIFFLSKLISLRKTEHKRQPPSPISLPIIGHLHLIKLPAHRSLQNLSNKYGPILSLSFGSRKVLLVSSPALVEECLTKNDIIFANRPFRAVGKYLHYNQTTIPTASYGPHWRDLRRVATLDLLSTNRINMYQNIRKQEIKILLSDLFENACTCFTKVEMQSRLSELTFNIIMRMITGKRYLGKQAENLEEAKRFKEIITETFEISEVSNPGDFLPFLEWIDFKSVKKMQRLHKKRDEFCQILIEKHKKNKSSLLDGEGKIETMVDKLLRLQELEPEFYSDEIVKGQILTLIFAGTDTSAYTVEWALSLLVNNPETLEKARAELDEIVGNERLVDESDCCKLNYLQNILNETLRLYPAVPLMLPHLSSEDCVIGGYDVPKGTTLIVNLWAIHRDPAVWKDPTSFMPERFKSSDSEGYKSIPFGVGRRSCPGTALATRVTSIVLATLIQCFEWERPSEFLIDMNEGSGVTLPKVQPLEVLCKARESMINVLEKI